MTHLLMRPRGDVRRYLALGKEWTGRVVGGWTARVYDDARVQLLLIGGRSGSGNLAALWRNFRAIGHHRLIYVNTASVLESQMILRAMSSDTPGEIDLVAVELTARDQTVAARLAVREDGSTLAWHVERSRRMAYVLAHQALPTTLRLATDDRDVTSIAAEVIDLSGWTPPDHASTRK